MRISVISLGVLILAAAFMWLPRQKEGARVAEVSPTAVSTSSPSSSPIFPPTPSPTPQPTPKPTPTPLPTQAVLPVPFLSQAPKLVWDPLHKDACEEASLIMVKRFIDKAGVDIERDDEEIKRLVGYQEERGYGVSVTVNQLRDIARDFYGMKGRVESATIPKIKKELAEGRAVIIPAAGRLLGNPNFTGEGPVYHMLVIKGYEGEEFIANDPGTRKGESFRYSVATIDTAIHDWNESDILKGAKSYLVFD